MNAEPNSKSAAHAVPAPAQNPASSKRTVWAAYLLIALTTLVAFAPVAANQLVNWDDLPTLVANDRYGGLTPTHLAWMFTTNLGGHYQPLSWVSFGIDYMIWGGVSPLGFHLTNVVLHILTAIAVFALARNLIGRVRGGRHEPGVVFGATVAAILFAVHPLRVESVAWATERRDVLSGVLLIASVLLYLRAVSPFASRRRTAFALSVGIYSLSLLAKASGVVLPLVLLVLDVFLLRRCARRGDGFPETSLPALIREKVAYAIPAALVAMLAIRAQSDAGALWSFTAHPLLLRVSQAFYGIFFYLGKSVWPANLVPLYEQPTGATPSNPEYLLAMAGVAGKSLLLFIFRKKWPALFSTWVCYALLLAPVLGILQSGPQLVADRYSYLSCIPWAILLGGLIAKTWATRSATSRLIRVALPTLCVIVMIVFVRATRAQVRVWKNSQTLWETTIARRPTTGLAYANLAAVYFQRGEFAPAIERAQQALSILGGNLSAQRILGQSALAQGDLALAEKHLRIAMRIAHDVGKTDPGASLGLANVWVRKHRFEEAEQLYRDLVAGDPTEPNWHFALGSFLASRGKLAGARAAFEEATRLNPSFVQAHLRLGIVLRMLGDAPAAAHALDRAIQLAPGDVNARAELAWLLATTRDDDVRNGPRAVALAKSAVDDSQGQSIRAREAYAAALAQTGAFAVASNETRELLNDPHLKLSDSVRVRVEDQLARYREGLAIRE